MSDFYDDYYEEDEYWDEDDLPCQCEYCRGYRAGYKAAIYDLDSECA